MSSATLEAKPRKRAWIMPSVRPGDIVNWWQGPGAPETHIAFVGEVADEMVDLLILVPNCSNFLCRSGVRHRDDPNVEAITNAGQGIWDLTHASRERDPGQLRNDLLAALARVDVLEAKVDELRRELGK